MSRWVSGAWIVAVFVLISIGNACAKNFTFVDDIDADSQTAQCREDESSLMDFSPAQMKTGYIGQKKIQYVPQDDDWILVDGDRLLKTKGQLPERPLPPALQQGVGVVAADRWPNGRIPYVIPSNMPEVTRLTNAINHWNTNLAGVIRLIPRTTETDYLQFNVVSSGCAAAVGYFAGGRQHPVNLSANCDSGNVAHEIGHVVGLDHEQNRNDRDTYVTIQMANVTAGTQANFNKDASNRDYNFYDFGSIMHYSLYAFSSNGLRTIVPRVTVPAGIAVGQRQGLSVGDINSVRLMYGHAVMGTTPTPTPSPTAPLATNQGLFARYYASVDFRNPQHETIDPNINFNWGSGSPAVGVPADQFSARWMGFLTPVVSGVYQFKIQAMDASRVVIDGQEVFKFIGDNSIRESVSISYQLDAGYRYPVMIDYSSASGDSYLRLYWKKPDGSEEIIPKTVLTPNSDSSISPCSASWLTE